MSYRMDGSDTPKECNVSNLFSIFLVVFLAVLAAMLVHSYIEYRVTLGFLNVASNQMNKITYEMQQKNKERLQRANEEQAQAREKYEQENSKRKTELDRQRNAQRIKFETCQSWTRRYAEEKTEYNKVMMKQACN